MSKPDDAEVKRFAEASREIGALLERLAGTHGSAVAVGSTLHLIAALAIHAGANREAFLGALGAAYDAQADVAARGET